MAVFPQKPRSGQKVLQGLYNSVCQIIDYLPTLEVRGDNSSTSVTKTSNGTIVHASNNNDQLSQNKRYFGLHGVKIKNNKYIFATLTGGTYIDVKYEDFNEQNEQYELPNPTINCTLSAGRYIQITPEGVINYTGPSGGGTTIVDNFGVPNLSALNFNNEPLANDGNGLTWLIPVSAGQQFTYSTGASGNVNASYAPAKGKSGSSFAITRDVLSTIPADGYIRITAFDDGLHHNQCLRVFDGTTNWNEGLPLYKFSNWSSAVIPSGGRYTTVQLTSTRLNAQEQEEIYTLPNPIINNMLSGGKYITIQETDEYDVKLQYPLINCTLHGDLSTVTIDADGTIHSIGGGGGTVIASGVGYPDHSKLFPDNYPAMSGLGISWLIPVSAGVEYRFYTDATGGEDEEENTFQVAYGKFAPSVGETGTVSSLTNGDDFIPDSNGWVRISVFDDGRNEGKCLRFYVNDEDGQYATPLYRFHGFTNYTAGAGITINSGIISCMIQPGQGLMSTALYDGNSNPYDPNRPITGIAFDLSTQFLNDLSTIYYGRNAVDKVLSSQNGNLVWATNVEPGGGGETYYADETTIKLSSTNNTFYLYDVEPALTGEGDIKIGNYGFDGVRRITSISATPYTGTDGIGVQNHVISLTATIPTKTSDLINDSHFITINDVPPGSVYQGDNVTIAASGTNNNIFYVIDGVFAPLTTVVNLSTELSGHIDYVSSNIPLSTSELVNDVPFVTSTWVDDNFISGGATGDHMYYNSQEKLLKCMLTGGTNIEIEDIGNYGYINCTLTGLDQLANTPGFITSPGPTPTAYYADNDTLSTTSNGTNFYVRNVSSLLTGAGGTTVYYYGTGLNNTIIAGISSYTYLPSTGIAILDDTTEGTCNKYIAVTGSFIDSSYYNFTNGLSTYNVLDANNNVIGQNVGLVETYRTILNTLSSSTTNANHNKVLSSSNDGTISWQTNTTSSPNWTSLTPSLLAVNNNNHTLSAATQSGGGIANFAPDYSYLSASEDAGMTTNGLGVTFLLPVNAGDTYRVESTGPVVVCTFAPVANSSTETTNVAANSTLTADTDGWVRVSVIDPGTSNGACVRFMVNGVPFANGLPLYKSKIMQNLTGDGDTIQIDGNQIKCISTPPPSSSSAGTAVNAKTSFCFTPDIYYAEPNVTYFTSYKHDIESEDDLAYTVDDLRWQFSTENIDEGGDIIIALPEVDYPCMVRVTNFDYTYTTVVTQDGKYIVGDDGGNQGWASGQQSDKVGMNETKIYVFQPTPIHWSGSYSGISAAIEDRGGVWWMQTFT